MPLQSTFRLMALLLGLGATVLAGCQQARAQNPSGEAEPVRRHLLKTAPIHLEEINLSYERMHRPNRSLQYGLGYLYQLHVNAGAAGEPVSRKVAGFALRVSQRTYNGRRFSGPEGGYRGPMAMYRYMAFPTSSYMDQQGQVNTHQLFQQVLSLQYMWGMQRVLWNWLVVDAYTGLGGRVKYASEQETGSEANYPMTGSPLYGYRAAAGPDWAILLGPSIHLNISVGVAF